MSMQTLTWDVDVAGNGDAYSLASAMQARQKWKVADGILKAVF